MKINILPALFLPFIFATSFSQQREMVIRINQVVCLPGAILLQIRILHLPILKIILLMAA
jgi:hypothetical protein